MKRINNGQNFSFLLVPCWWLAMHNGDTKAVRPTTALYGAHKAIKTSVQMYTLRVTHHALPRYLT